MHRFLAQGSYAKVYMDDDGIEVIKKLPKYVDGYLNYHAILDLSLQKTFGGVIPGVSKISSYIINEKYIIMRMPFYGSCISHRNVARENIPELIKQLVITLLQLQANGVQHTDIKPNNVLYDPKTQRLTLIDYNMISILINAEWCPSYGTWNFCAPEILHDSQPSDTSSVWSVALIIAYLYARYPLQEIYNISSKNLSSRKYWQTTFQNLENLHPDSFPLSPAHMKCMPSDMIDLFLRATTWDHKKRISLPEMFQALSGGEPCPPYFPQLLSVNVATNNSFMKRIFNICRATRTKPIFTRAAHIFQQYQEIDSAQPYLTACAAHYIAVMLTGCYVFDDNSFINNTLCYWDIKDELVVEGQMLKILNDLDWKIWGICPDWSFKDLLENDDKVLNAHITKTST